MLNKHLSIGVAFVIAVCGLFVLFGAARAQINEDSGNTPLVSEKVQTDAAASPASPQFVDKTVVNYQAPCKPGTRANVTTWHEDENGVIDDSRRAYDWRCHENNANNGGYEVYAPHAGKVKVKVNAHPEWGTVYIEDTENNACAILFHMKTEFNVTTGQTVAAGERIGSYYPGGTKDKCGHVGKKYICATGHFHLMVQDGLCSSSNYAILKTKERPVRFNEFGQLLSQRIALAPTTPGSTGGKREITVGECAGNVAPCVVPKDDKVPTGHLSDVPLNHPFFPYIETLYFLNVVSGNSQGKYEPDRNLTRAEASKIIILGIDENRTYSDGLCAFNDVCPGDAHYHTIRRMKELGIASADQSLFNPDDALTRGGMAKYVVLAYDRREPSSSCVGDILGVPCTNTFYKYVRRLEQIFDSKGFTLGNSQGQFNADDPVKRGEAAKLAVIGLGLDDDLPRFYDVPHDSKFLRYIDAIAERGITQGCDTSSSYPKFCPEQPLTRGQAAAFIVRSFGFTPYYSSGQTFSDTPRNNTFFHHIEFLARNGIVNGFSDGTFRPDAAVTRGEMAKMIINALVYLGATCQGNATPFFSDVGSGHTFFRFIQCMAQFGIANGYSDGQYKPDRNITRAEAAKFIYEAFLSTVTENKQESSNQANNQQQRATPLTSISQVTLPSDDVDWLSFSVPSLVVGAADSTVDNLYLLTIAPNINVDLGMQVIDAAGNVVPSTPASGVLEFEGAPMEHALLLSDLPPGDYSISLANQKEFATEGVGVAASIVQIDPTLLQPNTLGDVNCDRVSNPIDALFILQFDVRLLQGSSVCPPPANTLYLPTCDVDQDGDCAVLDALYILQCDVGFHNVFCPGVTAAHDSFSASAAPAQLSTTISAPNDSGEQTATVRADLAEHLLGVATIELHYDPAQIVVSGCTANPAADFMQGLCNPAFAPGVVRFNVLSTTGVTNTAELATLTFTSLAPAAPTFTLHPATFSSVSGVPIPVIDATGVKSLYLPIIQQ